MTSTMAILHGILHTGLLKNKGHDVTAEGKVVGIVLVALVGVTCLGVARLGWRHAEALVPSSLPADKFQHRCRVIRRGAVTFAILGVFCAVVVVAVAAQL